jgi:hypothetical protein
VHVIVCHEYEDNDPPTVGLIDPPRINYLQDVRSFRRESTLDRYSMYVFSDLVVSLYLTFRGLVLNLNPQHGHHKPFQLMNISHLWQRF